MDKEFSENQWKVWKAKEDARRKTTTRFNDQNLNLDWDELPRFKKSQVSQSRGVQLKGFILDGDSPYAEYLPAWFREYKNPMT